MQIILENKEYEELLLEQAALKQEATDIASSMLLNLVNFSEVFHKMKTDGIDVESYLSKLDWRRDKLLKRDIPDISKYPIYQYEYKKQ